MSGAWRVGTGPYDSNAIYEDEQHIISCVTIDLARAVVAAHNAQGEAEPAPDRADASARRAYIKCPFCGEDDFDEEGLSLHLFKYCEKGRHPASDFRWDELTGQLCDTRQLAADQAARIAELETLARSHFLNKTQVERELVAVNARADRLASEAQAAREAALRDMQFLLRLADEYEVAPDHWISERLVAIRARLSTEGEKGHG